MSIIQQKNLFLCGVSRLFWRETPQAEQTNDYFDSGNLQSELHKIKKQ